MLATSVILAMLATSTQTLVDLCEPPKGSLTSELSAPEATMTSVVIGTRDGRTTLTPQNVIAGRVTLSPETVSAWEAVVKGTPGPVLLWTRADKTRCAQELQSSEVPAPSTARSPDPGLGGAIRPATGECAVDGSAWLAALEETDPHRPKTVIVFRGANPCYRTDSFRVAVHGDPIYVAVLTDDVAPWSNATIGFTPCDIESAVPQVQASGEFPTSLRQSGVPWLLLTALPRSCWNDAVTISIKGSDAKAQAGYVLPQYGRYRATVHLGTLFTDQHKVTFGLQQQGAQKVIVNKGPIEKGPEYVASIVFYSVFRYLPPLWTQRAYKGREIRNEQGLVDRLGFSVGVGLKDPQERFTYGFTFELFSGVNLYGGWDRALLNVLPEGLEENQPFTGEEKDLQVRRRWNTKGVMGLTFDLAYTAKLFK
jgi:hypothetical protein